MPSGVRSVNLAVATVGCANSACLALGRARPDVVPIVHQHGCSQLGDDVDLTRAILTRLMLNPNVARSLVVGLGCESNQSDQLVGSAQSGGAAAAAVTIQDAGGLASAVARGAAVLDQITPRPRHEHPVCVGLMADDSAIAADEVIDAIATRLEAGGLRVLRSPMPAPGVPAVPAAGAGVPAVWRGATDLDVAAAVRAISPSAGRSAVPAGRSDVERMTALCAAGAEVIVLCTAQASPIGSPISPTVKVALDGALDGLDDIIDVAYGDGAGLAERVAAAVAAAVGGERVAAERNGARDVALWRVAPCF